MRVPEKLSVAFGADFEQCIAQFAVEHRLLPELNSIQSVRFLSRSVVPHILRLSSLFNREEKDQGTGLDAYWKESSNPNHLRLAYFLYFMPSNLYRVAAIWSELSRLGYRWQSPNFQAIEFGAGPASGACGIAAGEKYSPLGLPQSGTWALIEQDRSSLELGTQWAQTYFNYLGLSDWGTRPFHRKIDPSRGFLPERAPKFNLWLMSFYLNETSIPSQDLAKLLIQSWKNHLAEDGLIILVEPALRLQSRRLLELRRALIEESKKFKEEWLQILLPCLGHQNCGALADSDDWCHEEVGWWRPPYFRKIDKMAGLDRKTLPFSYLVLAKSKKSREELLPALAQTAQRHRLVSPAHFEGRDLEFFVCSQEGKRRARYRPPTPSTKNDPLLERGDILLDADIRGDVHSSRIETVKKIIP